MTRPSAALSLLGLILLTGCDRTEGASAVSGWWYDQMPQELDASGDGGIGGDASRATGMGGNNGRSSSSSSSNSNNSKGR